VLSVRCEIDQNFKFWVDQNRKFQQVLPKNILVIYKKLFAISHGLYGGRTPYLQQINHICNYVQVHVKQRYLKKKMK
jgi:hypothetical protein